MKATSVSVRLRIFLFAFKIPNRKPSIFVSEVVSPPTLTYIEINSTRSAKFIIDICIYNRPFKIFINRKEEGVGDLECGDVGETNGL